MSKLVSPNELHKAACDFMLEGREPESTRDWVLVVNCYAANIAVAVQPSAVILAARIMGCPLSDLEISEISNFQVTQSVRSN